MPKILTYNPSVNEVREVGIAPEKDPDNRYTLFVRRFENKILVETISDRHGHISTAGDLVRDTKLTVDQIKEMILLCFKEVSK